MSYILEALKKADAARERDREAVPGLHSRHDHRLPTESDEASEHAGADSRSEIAVRGPAALATRPIWLAAGVAGGAVIAGTLFWLLARPQPEATPTPLGSPTSQQVATAAHPGTQIVQEEQAEPAPPMPPAALQPAPVQPAAEPPRVAPPVPAAPAAPAAPTAPKPRPPAPDPLRVDPALRDSAPKIVPIQELPEHIRRELPTLTVSGAMYAEVPANRMLVLNGGVFREGDQPAPGVVLEEIRLKSAVLRHKGLRYSIHY